MLPIANKMMHTWGNFVEASLWKRGVQLKLLAMRQELHLYDLFQISPYGFGHPCIICFLYISAQQYIQDKQNFEIPSQITLWILTNFGNDNKTESTEIVT